MSYRLRLIGDGLLPADVDGKTKPKNDAPAPIVGTQDDGAGYGATFDALNIWELRVQWNSTATASLNLPANCRSPPSTRSSRARRRHATACRSLASPTRLNIWTFSPTVSAQPTVSPTVTSARMNLL